MERERGSWEAEGRPRTLQPRLGHALHTEGNEQTDTGPDQAKSEKLLQRLWQWKKAGGSGALLSAEFSDPRIAEAHRILQQSGERNNKK